MRILQINPVVKVGSTGRIVEQIGELILSKKWESIVVYSGRPHSESRSQVIKSTNLLSIYVHAIESRIFDNHGLASRITTFFLIRKLKKLNLDLIHLHNIHGYFINYPQLIKYITNENIPVVWTFHDFWPITGHCSYFSDIDCKKWETACSQCPKINYYPKSLWIDNSNRNFRLKKKLFTQIKELTIVSVSEWSKSLIKSSFLKDKRIETIYNGVDVKIFYPRQNRTELREKYHLNPKHKILIAAATTWSERKGLSDYVKLSKKLDENTKILLVGINNQQAQELPPEIISRPKTNNVIELSELYALSDIVLNLSYQETFGLTTVEGMSCGIPGIVYNCTASPELVNTSVGQIISPGDIIGVSNAVTQILNMGYDFYVDNCRNHVLQFFSLDSRFKQYITLYEEIINETKKNSHCSTI